VLTVVFCLEVPDGFLSYSLETILKVIELFLSVRIAYVCLLKITLSSLKSSSDVGLIWLSFNVGISFNLHIIIFAQTNNTFKNIIYGLY